MIPRMVNARDARRLASRNACARALHVRAAAIAGIKTIKTIKTTG